MLFVFALLLAVGLLTTAHATDVQKCKDRKIEAPKTSEITITNCNEQPCRLHKGTKPNLTLKFKADQDTPGIITNVNGIIGGIPFPFLGVDGTSACDKIYSEDGKTKVGCPLKKGETYTYKNSFQIMDIYPKIKLTVYWRLLNNKTKEDISCFEVPSKIV